MFRSALICCALFVASATCYDLFSESSDNGIFDRSPVYRVRRDAFEAHFPQCCGKDFSVVPLIILGTHTEYCKAGPSEEPDTKAHVENYLCYAECIAQQEGTVKYGEIDEERVIKFIRNYDRDQYRVQAYKKNLPKCVREAQETQKNIGHKIRCDSTAGALTTCLNQELVNQCPKNYQNENEKSFCKKMRLDSDRAVELLFT